MVPTGSGLARVHEQVHEAEPHGRRSHGRLDARLRTRGDRILVGASARRRPGTTSSPSTGEPGRVPSEPGELPVREGGRPQPRLEADGHRERGGDPEEVADAERGLGIGSGLRADEPPEAIQEAEPFHLQVEDDRHARDHREDEVLQPHEEDVRERQDRSDEVPDHLDQRPELRPRQRLRVARLEQVL